MRKKLPILLVPFLLLFALGLILLLRPHWETPVVSVVERFSRQEKTGQRSAHRHTVTYAIVEVANGDEAVAVKVHEPAWDPLEPGDTVTVGRKLFGGIDEYDATTAYRLMGCAAFAAPLTLLLYYLIAGRKRK